MSQFADGLVVDFCAHLLVFQKLESKNGSFERAPVSLGDSFQGHCALELRKGLSRKNPS
jgi:hypothetical protein